MKLSWSIGRLLEIAPGRRIRCAVALSHEEDFPGLARARSDSDSLVEAVRAACIKAALLAYDDAGIRGLCHERRLGMAPPAKRHLDLRVNWTCGRGGANE